MSIYTHVNASLLLHPVSVPDLPHGSSVYLNQVRELLHETNVLLEHVHCREHVILGLREGEREREGGEGGGGKRERERERERERGGKREREREREGAF